MVPWRYYALTPGRLILLVSDPHDLQGDDEEVIQGSMDALQISHSGPIVAARVANALLVGDPFALRGGLELPPGGTAWAAVEPGQWIPLCWQCPQYMGACDGTASDRDVIDCGRAAGLPRPHSSDPELRVRNLPGRRARWEDLAVWQGTVVIQQGDKGQAVRDAVLPLKAICELVGDDRRLASIFLGDYCPLDELHVLRGGQWVPYWVPRVPHEWRDPTGRDCPTVRAWQYIVSHWARAVEPNFGPTTRAEVFAVAEMVAAGQSHWRGCGRGLCWLSALLDAGSVRGRALSQFILSLWVDEFAQEVAAALGVPVEDVVEIHRGVWGELMSILKEGE